MVSQAFAMTRHSAPGGVLEGWPAPSRIIASLKAECLAYLVHLFFLAFQFMDQL